jgi:hypothetical protein
MGASLRGLLQHRVVLPRQVATVALSVKADAASDPLKRLTLADGPASPDVISWSSRSSSSRIAGRIEGYGTTGTSSCTEFIVAEQGFFEKAIAEGIADDPLALPSGYR